MTTTEANIPGARVHEKPFWSRLESRLAQPRDGAWLAAFRIIMGGLFAISMERYLAYGWVDKLLVGPEFQFKYFGFHWVQPVSREHMVELVQLLGAFGLMMSVGLLYRVAAFGFALGFSYIQLIDAANYLNHYYLAALLAWMLALSPAGRLWSVDAWATRWWRRRKAAAEIKTAAETAAPETAAPESEQVIAAWHYLFRAQAAIVYTFAGIAKLQSDWLVYGMPLRIWLGSKTDLPLLGPIFTWQGVPLLMSWCGFLFDLSIVIWLSFRKTRPWAYLVVIGFHLFTKLLFNIGMFPFIMVLVALVFFSPSWPRVLVNFVRTRSLLAFDAEQKQPASGTTGAPVRAISSRMRLCFALGGIYCAIQLLLPLRFLAYGGNVLWHEQGMRFSWRVMVRQKGGGNTFFAHNVQTGKLWVVPASTYLTRHQEDEMSGQPALILQLAQYIERDFESRNLGPVAVRVDSQISLNGRRAAPLIDPHVDLTQVRDNLAAANWILPAPPGPPPLIRPVR